MCFASQVLFCGWFFFILSATFFAGAAFGFAGALFGHGGFDESFELGLVEFAVLVLVVILEGLVEVFCTLLLAFFGGAFGFIALLFVALLLLTFGFGFGVCLAIPAMR